MTYPTKTSFKGSNMPNPNIPPQFQNFTNHTTPLNINFPNPTMSKFQPTKLASQLQPDQREEDEIAYEVYQIVEQKYPE